MTTMKGMTSMRASSLIGCCLLATLNVCALEENAESPASTTAPPWVAPIEGHPADGVERLGSRAITDVGLARVHEVLHLDDDRWLVAGATSANRKELRLFDAGSGTSTFLHALGGEFDDVPSFALMAAPFASNGMRPIAVLAMHNYGGRCCVDYRIDLTMALLDTDGKLHSTRQVVAAKTGYLIDRFPSNIDTPLPYDESEIVEEGKVFFLRPESPSGAGFVLWRKQCQGNDEPIGDVAGRGSGPCGQGMSLVDDSLRRFTIAADAPAIRDARSVDDAESPPPTFWGALPSGSWTDHEIGVSQR